MPEIWISLHYTHFDMLFNGVGWGSSSTFYFIINQALNYSFMKCQSHFRTFGSWVLTAYSCKQIQMIIEYFFVYIIKFKFFIHLEQYNSSV